MSDKLPPDPFEPDEERGSEASGSRDGHRREVDDLVNDDAYWETLDNQEFGPDARSESVPPRGRKPTLSDEYEPTSRRTTRSPRSDTLRSGPRHAKATEPLDKLSQRRRQRARRASRSLAELAEQWEKGASQREEAAIKAGKARAEPYRWRRDAHLRNADQDRIRRGKSFRNMVIFGVAALTVVLSGGSALVAFPLLFGGISALNVARRTRSIKTEEWLAHRADAKASRVEQREILRCRRATERAAERLQMSLERQSEGRSGSSVAMMMARMGQRATNLSEVAADVLGKTERLVDSVTERLSSGSGRIGSDAVNAHRAPRTPEPWSL